MIVEFECFNCKGKNGKEFDGCLGYESIICKDCGAVHDVYGVYTKEGVQIMDTGLQAKVDKHLKEMDEQIKLRGWKK